MPPSESEAGNAASRPVHQPSADDLIARLVEEIAGATGGSIRDNTEIAVIEERLSELRTLALAPHAPAPLPPPPEPVSTTRSSSERRALSSADDVILEAVRSSRSGSERQPDTALQRSRVPYRSRQHRSHASIYLVALFLVCFAIGVLLFNRSWFEALTSSGENWGWHGVAAPPPASSVAAEPASTPANWVRRKVKTYRVDADGVIDYGVDLGPEQLAGR